jgi:1-phosphofructokinase
MSLLEDQLENTDILVVSGALPPEAPDTLYKDIIEMSHSRGVPVILDAHSAPFIRGMEAAPFMIKPNAQELAEAFGKQADDLKTVLELGQRCLEYGIQNVCVSRGPQGAVMITRDTCYVADPVDVPLRGFQGAGDSMVAGMCQAITLGLPTKELLRYGVAAATGTLTHQGTGLCTNDDLQRYLGEVVIHEI